MKAAGERQGFVLSLTLSIHSSAFTPQGLVLQVQIWQQADEPMWSVIWTVKNKSERVEETHR